MTETLGFIIIRHINNDVNALFWKENYTCIRKYYDNPIIIIDDNSNKDLITDESDLVNCTIIYDKDHRCAAEFLPYYYFHTLKPFDIAVIIHDSVFIKSKINFSLDTTENVRFLWTFIKNFDYCVFNYINELCKDLPHYEELMNLYNQSNNWNGSFGTMSVIRWNFIDHLEKKHKLFDNMLPKINHREIRSALERVFGLLAYYNDPSINPAFFGDIHQYMQYEITYKQCNDYDFSAYPIIKVWTGR